MAVPPAYPYRQHDRKDQPLELYKPHIIDKPEGEITNVFTHSTRLNIAAVVAAAYPIMFVFYVVFEDDLWAASVNTSAYLSQFGGFKWYNDIFSEVLYKWYPFVFGLLLVISPRKDSALKAGFVFYASHLFRNYVRLSITETRPYYTTLRIQERSSCNCSFGMPSGHSEGTTMLYSIVLYDWILQTRHYARWKKIVGVVVVAWIVLSVMVSRVYYGKHSIPQVLLGTMQALFFLSFMCIYEDHLDKYFHDFLQRKRYAVVSLFIVCLVISIVNVVVWITIFDDKTRDHRFFFVRCSKCFEDENLLLRKDLSTSLVFTSMTLGLIIGYIFARVHYLGHNDYMVNQHFSWKGLARILLMLVYYSPLLIIMFVNLDPNTGVIVYSLVYILSGFLASYVETKVRRWLNLEFKGDILAGAPGEEYLKLHYASDDAEVVEDMKSKGIEGAGSINPFRDSGVSAGELNNAYHDPNLAHKMIHNNYNLRNGTTINLPIDNYNGYGHQSRLSTDFIDLYANTGKRNPLMSNIGLAQYPKSGTQSQQNPFT